MSFTLWFTGLPASGKSTIALEMQKKLLELEIHVEVIESDDIMNYYNGLLSLDSFGRKVLVRNMAVCSELLNRNGIPVLATSTTPTREGRDRVREVLSCMVLVYCYVSIETARKRDPKGLYVLAERGVLKDFPGPRGVYEPPLHADVQVNTEELDIEQCCEQILFVLEKRSFIKQGHRNCAS